MAKAHKTPAGNWRVQASVKIGTEVVKKSFTAPTAKKAELAALEWQMKTKEIARDTSVLTVSEAVDEYVKLKGNVMSPSTIRCYINLKKNQLAPVADMRLNKLTRNIVQGLVNDLAGKYSPKTVKNAYCLLTAVIDQYAPDIKLGKIMLPQPEKKEKKALSRSQIGKLINAVDGTRYEIPVLFALWLGLRRSEVLALEWSDIDFDAKTVRVSKALVPDVNGDFVLKGTKTTESTRTLPLPPYIEAKLLERGPGEGRIVTDCTANVLSKGVKSFCEKNGIGSFTYHDLRRSMATVGMELNIADKILMARGGWSNPQTMKEIYQVVLAEKQNSAAEQYNEYFMSAIAGE